MALQIRNATAADAPALSRLWSPWIKETNVTFNAVEKTADDLVLMIAQRQSHFGFWLAELDHELAGFVTYAQFRAGVGYARAMEHTIILSPAAQGRGIGRALMHRAEKDALSKGASQMIAAVTGENTAGRHFHQKLGYDVVAIIPKVGYKFDRYHDLIVMQKFLS